MFPEFKHKRNEKDKSGKKFGKSFTLVELIVVIGVMGLIIGGLLISMSQIMAGQLMLKEMQKVEGESRFIMDLFAQDAEYSSITSPQFTNAVQEEKWNQKSVSFSLTEKKNVEEINNNPDQPMVTYQVEKKDPDSEVANLVRTLKIGSVTSNIVSTLNTIDLVEKKSRFHVHKVQSTEGYTNYITTISLSFKVKTKTDSVEIPVQTSVVSRVFEL